MHLLTVVPFSWSAANRILSMLNAVRGGEGRGVGRRALLHSSLLKMVEMANSARCCTPLLEVMISDEPARGSS